MKKEKLLQAGACLIMACAMGCYSSCQEELSEDAHYKAPDFLVGNAIEVLQKDGDYKTFLKGIDLIGYTKVVESQILTVLAPTDEAFASFLKEKGYSSIEDMYSANPLYTQQVITYHLLYYAMNWDKMTNFRPNEGDGATELDKANRAGMYNRFRTRCQVPISYEFNPNPAVKDTVPVIHWDRYLTVFSEKMFQTLGIDAASNYNYFFPNTVWNPNHLANGFNVMNAAVLDTAAVVTDNGYLYHIDHVIEPVGTIYEELKDNGNYQKYVSLFDSYAEYIHETNESANLGFKVYEKVFRSLPSIAAEWPSTSYLSFATNSFNSWNLFIPTDQALDKLFREYWSEGCGYTSIENLNPLIKQILLQESAAVIAIDGSRDIRYMCYPDYIRQGRAISTFGTDITTDPGSFDVNIMCNNGVIYGSSKMDVPGVFSSVAGPAFKDVKYLPYLYALNGADLLLSLSSKETDFITLIPDTAQFVHHDPAMRLYESPDKTGNPFSLQQFSAEDGGYVDMGGSTLKEMVNMNTTTEATELKSTGIQVIETNQSFNYWYVRDGQITTNALFNEQLNPSFVGQVWSNFHEIQRSTSGENWSNGRAYAYDYTGVFMPASGVSLETELSQNNDRYYPYYCFVQLLQKSGLASGGKFVGMLQLDPSSPRFFVIVPTNDAIKTALKELPGCSSLSINESTYAITGTVSSTNKQKLADYLLSYFVTADRNSFRSYPYVGSSCTGKFETSGIYSISIMDDGKDLSVKFGAQKNNTPEGNEVQLVDKYYYLPFAFSDGAFQLIDTVLK